MRCLVVSCVYPPELVVSAQTSEAVAAALSRRGDSVTVVAPFPSRNGASPRSAGRPRLFRRQTLDDGCELVRCYSFVSTKSDMLARLVENVTFGLTSAWVVLRAPRPDVIYANTWPIFAAFLLLLAARVRSIPLVLSVQDVYPESLASQGRIKAEGALARGMRAIDDFVVRRCAATVLITPPFLEIYRTTRGHSPERLHVVPNWRDAKSVVVDEEGAARFREKIGLPPRALAFVCGGNIGPGAGVETLIEAFGRLRDDDRLYLVVAGEGSSLESCRAAAAGLDTVVFHHPWRKEETSAVLCAADVLLVPTVGRQSLVSAPSKLIGYLLAARPVVALAFDKTYLAHMIEESGAGWTIEPDNPGLLAAKIREIAGLAAGERGRRGAAGREFALKNLTTEACLPRLVAILDEAARAG